MTRGNRRYPPAYLLLTALPIVTVGYVFAIDLSAETPIWGRVLAVGFPAGVLAVFVWYGRWLATRQHSDLFLRYGSLAGLVAGPLYTLPAVGMAAQQRAAGVPLVNSDVLIVEMCLGGSVVGLALGHLYATTQVEQRRLRTRERRLEQQRQQLTVLNRVLRHDIRTEVELILCAADELSSRSDEPSKLDEIRRRSRKIAEIGDNARQIERMMDRRNPTNTVTDAVDVVEDARANLASRLSAAAVSVDAPGEAPVVSNGLLTTAVENVLANAVEHNDAPTPSVEVTVRADTDDETVQIRVADNGPGIPKQEREVFENVEETRFRHSSGLGLWLVHWIVSDLNGAVHIEDRQPRGTLVTIRVPRAPAATDRERTTTRA